MDQARRSGSRRGWPWCVPKLLIVSDYHQMLTCPQGPFQTLFFINSVIPQVIPTILTICPIFQTVINIPQTTILFPSNIIGSYHITKKHQCMMIFLLATYKKYTLYSIILHSPILQISTLLFTLVEFTTLYLLQKYIESYWILY